MKNLVIYRVLSYILLFVAAFFAAGILTSIPGALLAPVALLPLFLMSCIVIYTYCSWRFLVRGIDKGMYLKPTLRDLIRVNGYITLVLAGLMFFMILVMASQASLIGKLIDDMKAIQVQQPDITEEMLVRQVHFLLRFLATYSALLVVHTIITFRLMKQYRDVFEEPEDIQE